MGTCHLNTSITLGKTWEDSEGACQFLKGAIGRFRMVPSENGFGIKGDDHINWAPLSNMFCKTKLSGKIC